MLDGKQVHRLVTWSQRRCEKCQRFLNKHQQKYCASCVKIVEKERSLNRKEERLLRGKIYWSPNRFNVGDYV
jgi:rRNA maturation endonuclease Nob1